MQELILQFGLPSSRCLIKDEKYILHHNIYPEAYLNEKKAKVNRTRDTLK
jgi:hypothetical protein